MNKILRILEKYTIYITVFLVPLAFLPIFSNPFSTPKITIVVLGVSLALIFRLLQVATSGTFEFNQGTFDFPVFLMIAAYALSGIFTTPNRPEAFFLPGGATIFIACGILYFLVNQLESSERDQIIYVLIISGVLVSLTYFLAIAGVLEKMPNTPPALKNRNFTLGGDLLSSVIFLVSLIPYGIGLLLTTKDYFYKALVASATVIIAISIGIASFNIITDRTNSNLPSLESSVAVTFDSLKTSALLGVGPSNYLTAYTRFRPIEVNQTDAWRARFTQARNFYLTHITETGFVGIFAIVLLIIVIAKTINKEGRRTHRKIPLVDARTGAVTFLFVVLAFFPASVVEIVLVMFLSLALASKTKTFKLQVASITQAVHLRSRTSRLPAIIAVTPILVGVVYLLFTGGKTLAAERNYKIALDHLAKNEAAPAYETLQRAINANPYVDRYHATYSQLNFLLADATARNSQKPTDEDRETIKKLIEQAIREAKNTAALNFTRAGNWEVLASLYRNIIPFSKDAANFAIQAYTQATILDPYNPDLRIALGGIWYASGNYENAIRTFELAVVAKADRANARYNLAAAYREAGQIERAIAELKIVLTLVKEGTNDQETAKKELEALESQKASAPAEGETLTSPPTGEAAIEPQIDLSESAAPESLASPKPSEGGSPTPSP